jgi:hypothetical protein
VQQNKAYVCLTYLISGILPLRPRQFIAIPRSNRSANNSGLFGSRTFPSIPPFAVAPQGSATLQIQQMDEVWNDPLNGTPAIGTLTIPPSTSQNSVYVSVRWITFPRFLAMAPVEMLMVLANP